MADKASHNVRIVADKSPKVFLIQRVKTWVHVKKKHRKNDANQPEKWIIFINVKNTTLLTTPKQRPIVLRTFQKNTK